MATSRRVKAGPTSGPRWRQHRRIRDTPPGSGAVRRDTDERIRAERDLFRLALESANAIVYEWDLGSHVEWFGAVDRLLGYEAGEFPRTLAAWEGALHPEDHDRVLSAVQAHLAGREPYAIEYRIRARDGSVRWWSARGVVVRSPDGAANRWLGTVTDVSARRAVEEALRHSEDKFKYFFEQSPVAKSITLPTGELSVNAAFCRMLGFSSEDLHGRSWQDVTHPDDMELTRRHVEALIAGEADSARFVKRYVAKDGAVVWADVTTSLRRTDGGQPLYFVTSALDISDRILSEEALRLAHERLRTFIDANIVGVVVARADGAIVEANDYYLRLVGFTREALQEGRVDWRAITPPEWLPADEAALRELAERGVCSPYEKEYLRADGSRVPVFLADARLPGPNGEIAAFALDLTEIKRTAQEVRRLNAELEQRVRDRTAQLECANRELEAFSYSVSHDLRAPLRRIDGWSLALAEDCAPSLSEEGMEHLARIRSEAQRMGRLIDAMLKLSRIGMCDLRRQAIDVSAAAESILARLATQQPARRVEAHVQPGLAAEADPLLLESALSNLLENAWKFTAHRDPAVIEVGGDSPPGAPFVYFVRDNGAGFDATSATTLFGPFQRMHRASEFPGTGVGLASAQRIIHRHGGRIWAEAAVDAGATFFFTLRAGS